MRRSSRILLALVSAALLVGTGAMGAAAAPRPAAPAIPVAQTAKAASPAAAHVAQTKKTETNVPTPGQRHASPSDGSVPGTNGSVAAAAQALPAARSKAQPEAKPGVAYHTLSGTVTDEFSDPLYGIDVLVCEAYNCLQEPASTDVTTDSLGYWSASVPDGWYSITFWDGYYTPPYATGWYSNSGIVYNPGEADRINLSGADVGSLDVAMKRFYDVSGRVQNSSSVNLNNIVIEAWIDGGWYATAETEADGTYGFYMPPGDTTLFLYDNNTTGTYPFGWWVNPSVVSYFSSDATSISITNSNVVVNATLTAARHIKGKVTNASGTGLQYVGVVAYCNGSAAAWTITPAGGAYSLPVVAGSYTLEFTAFGSAGGPYESGWRGSSGLTLDESQASLVTVGSADVTAINVALPHLARQISGVVKDSTPSYLQNIEVDAYLNGVFYDSTMTDDLGSYSIAVPAGTYQLYFYDATWTYADGYWSASGFQQWWIDAGSVVVSTADATGKNVVLPLVSVPGAPTAVEGAGYNESAMVWWTHPANRGGLDDLSYTVTSDPDAKTCTSYILPSCTVNGLTNGQAYTFTVTATNMMGTGDPSVASADVTPAAVPDAPDVTAVGFDKSIVVGWDAPADNGSAITGYTATAWLGSDGSHSCTTTTALTCPIGSLTNGTYYWIAVTATNGAGTGPEGWTDTEVAPRAGNSFVPVTPNRILDTHTGLGISTSLAANVPATFTVTNQSLGVPAGNVPTGATAVTGVLSVSNATKVGFLSLTPVAPVGPPTTSTINFPAGDARATGVTVTLSNAGTLSLTYGAASGTADAAFDVTGYFVLGTSGSTYVALTPNRILDTRSNAKIGITTGPLVAGTHKSFAVTGRIPTDVTKNVPTGAVAVTGTLTVTGQTAAGFLTLGPDPLNAPTTASLFFPKGDNRATGLTIKLASDGSLNVTFTSSTVGAKTDAIFDVNGYFMPGEDGAMYVPLTPNRLVDTRIKLGITAPLKNHIAATFQVTGRVPADPTKNVPSGAVAVTGTLTVTGQSSLGWLSLTTLPNNNPTTSSLNFPKGDNRATGVTVPLSGAGKLSVTYGAIAGATTQVIFDVSGYFVN